MSWHIYFRHIQLCTTLLLMFVREQHTDTILSRNVVSSPWHGNTTLIGTFADKSVYLFLTVPITLWGIVVYRASRLGQLISGVMVLYKIPIMLLKVLEMVVLSTLKL